MQDEKFIKVANEIKFKPNVKGLDYNLENGKIYSVSFDRFRCESILNILQKFNMPKKVYMTEKDKIFINKIITHHNNIDSGTTGVMLSGMKGAGKTVIAKQIATLSNLPILIFDVNFPSSYLVKFFNMLGDLNVCIIFDEAEKDGNLSTSELLKVMDGVNTIGKKLIIFTCNNQMSINEYICDRCSRIRYCKKFEELDIPTITEIVKDKAQHTNIDSIVKFIVDNFKCINFDNVFEFINEINQFGDESLDDLFEDMNLTRK